MSDLDTLPIAVTGEKKGKKISDFLAGFSTQIKNVMTIKSTVDRIMTSYYLGGMPVVVHKGQINLLKSHLNIVEDMFHELSEKDLKSLQTILNDKDVIPEGTTNRHIINHRTEKRKHKLMKELTYRKNNYKPLPSDDLDKQGQSYLKKFQSLPKIIKLQDVKNMYMAIPVDSKPNKFSIIEESEKYKTALPKCTLQELQKILEIIQKDEGSQFKNATEGVGDVKSITKESRISALQYELNQRQEKNEPKKGA